MQRAIEPLSSDANARLSRQLGLQARAARKAKGLSIRAAARHIGCSPRFVQELEQGKPTARMDKVMQLLSGLGLQLSVDAADAVRPTPGEMARAEARTRQRLHEEKLARTHGLIAARLALGTIPRADIERARKQVRKWTDQQICSQWYVDQWTHILSGSGRQIASKMIALGKADAEALFQNTPFGFIVRADLRA